MSEMLQHKAKPRERIEAAKHLEKRSFLPFCQKLCTSVQLGMFSDDFIGCRGAMITFTFKCQGVYGRT